MNSEAGEDKVVMTYNRRFDMDIEEFDDLNQEIPNIPSFNAKNKGDQINLHTYKSSETMNTIH